MLDSAIFRVDFITFSTHRTPQQDDEAAVGGAAGEADEEREEGAIQTPSLL